MKLITIYRHRIPKLGLRFSMTPGKPHSTFGTCPAKGTNRLKLLPVSHALANLVGTTYVRQERTNETN